MIVGNGWWGGWEYHANSGSYRHGSFVVASQGQHSENRLYFDDSLSGSGAEDPALTWLEDVASDASLDPQLLSEDEALPASELSRMDSVPSPARSPTVQTTLDSTSSSALSTVARIRSGVAPDIAPSEPQDQESTAPRPLPTVFFACARRASELATHWAAEKRYRRVELAAQNLNLHDAAVDAAKACKRQAADALSAVHQRLEDYGNRARRAAAEDRVNLARQALEACPSADVGALIWSRIPPKETSIQIRPSVIRTAA